MGKPGEELQSKEIQIVILQIHHEEFGVEIKSVLEISRMLNITQVPQAADFAEGVINLRGQVITVLNAARLFGLRNETNLTKETRIVIVEIQNEKMGLIVDAVPEVLRMSEAKIEAVPEYIQSRIERDYVKGVAKNGERLILVIDLERMGNSRFSKPKG